MNKKNNFFTNTGAPFPEKPDLNCPHFEKCSGCEISANLNTPPIFEEAKNYFEKKGIQNLQLITGNVNFWRYRAKLVVRGTSDNPQIGLYKKGTHEVLDIPFCKVHHPNINIALNLVKEFIRQNAIEPYNETTKKGLLRYLQFVVERKTGKVQVTFVLNKAFETETTHWQLPFSDIWHSVWLNFNQSATNNIFGTNWTHLQGPLFMFEQFGEVSVALHPASFAQSNLRLFEQMLNSIKNEIPVNSKVVEFYAGVGVIGLKIASKCQSVICSEIIPQAEICFLESKSKLEPAIADKISFKMGPSENALSLIDGKDVVIVDPPRKGLCPSLLKAIAKNEALKKLIYISCGWKAFQRDCDYLLDHEWMIEKIEPYLFFPGSNHLEIFAIFKKK